ncbi:enoyl-CoA hydratase/isomerase family protein [Brevibacterium sp. FAM 24638]|uniref:enoyl-CoA hydratase/isomerase family protein n=1 Tax=Brevibacterium sp. FAM 24638 TaxID=3415681 RepID=UPI003C7A469D
MSGITLERTDGVGTITIDRPEKLNALTLAMYEELSDAFDEVRDDPEIGVAVLTGAGDRSFCVGADLNESIPALAEERFDISEWDGAHQKHSRLFKPVIAAVNGLCLGGGFEIMLSTDLRIAADSARFGLPEPGVGVVPAGGTLARLTRQIPYPWAMELLLTGDPIDAATAERRGLINRAVPAEELLDEANALARRLLERSGSSLSVIKSAAAQLAEMPLSAAFHAEALYGQRAFASPDAKEGLAAFSEGRAPRFPSRRPPNTSSAGDSAGA